MTRMHSDPPTSGALPPQTSFGRPFRALFPFSPSYTPLNHGSYGATPTHILQHRRALQHAVESRPDIYTRFTYPDLLAASRAAVAPLLGAHVGEVVLLANATTGVNTVLHNLSFALGDVVLCFDSVYPACFKTVQALGETRGVGVKVLDTEAAAPLEDDDVVELFRSGVQAVRREGKTPRLGIFDTVSSLPGIRVPWERLVAVCREEGILSLVDAAHGVGHIDMRQVGEVSPDFLVSNCHKWLYVPRGCAVFYVPFRNQQLITTAVPTSHGYEPPDVRKQVEKGQYFVDLFTLGPTTDFTPLLCVPEALRFRDEVCGGEEKIRDYCFRLAKRGGDTVARILETEVLGQTSGSANRCTFANVRLPLVFTAGSGLGEPGSIPLADAQAVFQWIYETATRDYDTYFQIKYYKTAFWVRLSAQVYLDVQDFEWAGETLLQLCDRARKREWKKSQA